MVAVLMEKHNSKQVEKIAEAIWEIWKDDEPLGWENDDRPLSEIRKDRRDKLYDLAEEALTFLDDTI